MNDELPNLCAPLDSILRSELDLGNEIGEVLIGGWTKVDTVVYLKSPFHRKYPESGDIIFYRNTDAHYSLGESYTSAEHRQAVEAPY